MGPAPWVAVLVLSRWAAVGLQPVVREGRVVVRGGTREMYLRQVRPMSLTSKQHAPVLVCHGGPGVPSDYLWALGDLVPYRTLIFFDQLGCGRSEAADAYSIAATLDDVRDLTKKLGLRRYHLYGQSFGGLLAHAYASRNAAEGDPSEEILSLALSSAPARPEALVAAYEHAADPESGWRGSSAIRGYVAPPRPEGITLPSAIVTRGEHDFVTDACFEDWTPALSRFRKRTFAGCSHHGLLEDPEAYAETFESFWCEYD